MNLLRKGLDGLLFSCLFISVLAAGLVWQTLRWFSPHAPVFDMCAFVFFSTLCSYNFHYLMTPILAPWTRRKIWSKDHRLVHLSLCGAGGLGAFVYFIPLRHLVWAIAPGALLTFLYTAPKIPLRFFQSLQRLAIGKTLYLSLVWTYATVALPILAYEKSWTGLVGWFILFRFGLLYALCILFDYRDREEDRQQGIRSMVTYFAERGIDGLYGLALFLLALSLGMMHRLGIPVTRLWAPALSGLLAAAAYPLAKRNFSDYLYLLFLDGLLGLSCLT